MKKPITLKECMECCCQRCGHIWTAKGKTVPKVCANPACHSPHWQKAKKEKREKG